ncbi:50S ribosomal protein L1, partial [Candidatus Saccharibacteria bacterium]|nr:50S ribosomal protein L1 [Candidatus Saccharibacteria bacterium]
TGIVHVGVGKVSFGGAKLHQNAQAILDSLKSNRPSGIKGGYVRSMYVTTSMGPSIQVTQADL